MTKQPKQVTSAASINSYRETCERLVLLLSVSRYEVELLESRLKRYEDPTFAGANFLKSVDAAILKKFGMSIESMAHVIPKDVVNLEKTDFQSMSGDELASMINEYDSRFAEAELLSYLSGPRRVAGRSYRYAMGFTLERARRLRALIKRIKR